MRKFVKRPYDRGFTLIELLVVIAIIGILGSMGVVNYRILRARVYASQVTSEMHDLRNALEAGKIELSEAGGFYGGWTMTAGPMMSWSGSDFAPGFINRDGIMVSAWLDADCDAASPNPWCMQISASVSSCKSGKSMSSWTWRDGTSFNWEWQGVPWC